MVKSSSSTVIQYKIHLIHHSHHFLFQMVRKHRVPRTAMTQSSFQRWNQIESSIFQLFRNFQVKKLSAWHGHNRPWKMNKISFIIQRDFFSSKARNYGSLLLVMTTMVNSTVVRMNMFIHLQKRRLPKVPSFLLKVVHNLTYQIQEYKKVSNSDFDHSLSKQWSPIDFTDVGIVISVNEKQFWNE